MYIFLQIYIFVRRSSDTPRKCFDFLLEYFLFGKQYFLSPKFKFKIIRRQNCSFIYINIENKIICSKNYIYILVKTQLKYIPYYIPQ